PVQDKVIVSGNKRKSNCERTFVAGLHPSIPRPPWIITLPSGHTTKPCRSLKGCSVPPKVLTPRRIDFEVDRSVVISIRDQSFLFKVQPPVSNNLTNYERPGYRVGDPVALQPRGSNKEDLILTREAREANLPLQPRLKTTRGSFLNLRHELCSAAAPQTPGVSTKSLARQFLQRYPLSSGRRV